jgi:hypothetical protein
MSQFYDVNVTLTLNEQRTKNVYGGVEIPLHAHVTSRRNGVK